MKSTLVIFTNSFPFGFGETFIDNEVTFWADFDKVILVSSKNDFKLRYSELPTNVSVFRISKWKWLDRFLNIIKALLRKEFSSELPKLNLSKKIGLLRLRHLLGFTALGNYLVTNLVKIIKNELAEGSTVYLYSYWMNQWAYVSALISQKYNIPAITRAHRYDLYSERNELNYLPLRSFIYNHLNGIYPISENGKQYLEKKFNSNIKIHLYRLGTFDKGLSPEPDYTNDIIRIISCSWVSPVKRLDRIIDSLKLIQDRRIEWIHIGDGELLDSIKKQTSILTSNIKVKFLGAMTQDEIYQFYKEIPINYFINVSESEGIPVSIMEAMSMGIPVLATDVGGTSEIVKDGLNGVLLNSRYNPEDLAKILRSHNYNKKYRINARSIWDNEFNAQKNYSNFFSNLLSINR